MYCHSKSVLGQKFAATFWPIGQRFDLRLFVIIVVLIFVLQYSDGHERVKIKENSNYSEGLLIVTNSR